MNTIASIAKAFAPNGRLRASINLGNPILAGRDAESGEVRGVSVDLAREFGRRLGIPVDLVVFDTAGKSVDAVSQDEADIGFFAIDPKRAEAMATDPLGPAPKNADVRDLAAWTVVANVLLNLDETLAKR